MRIISTNNNANGKNIMAIFTINSRKFGEQEFTVSSAGGYVRLNGHQICRGGLYLGSTLSCTPEQLEKVARKWWADKLKIERNY